MADLVPAQVEIRGGPYDQPEGQPNRVTVILDDDGNPPPTFESRLSHRDPDTGQDGPFVDYLYELRTEGDTQYYELVSPAPE